MKNFKHKSVKPAVDMYPNLSPIQRHVEFLRSRGMLTIDKHLEVIKSHKIAKNL